jgi:hypothetical protein
MTSAVSKYKAHKRKSSNFKTRGSKEIRYSLAYSLFIVLDNGYPDTDVKCEPLARKKNEKSYFNIGI